MSIISQHQVIARSMAKGFMISILLVHFFCYASHAATSINNNVQHDTINTAIANNSTKLINEHFCDSLFTSVNFSSLVEVHTITFQRRDGARYPFWLQCHKSSPQSSNVADSTLSTQANRYVFEPMSEFDERHQYLLDVAKKCEPQINKRCQTSKLGLLTPKSIACPVCGLGDLTCENLHHCMGDCGQLKSVNYPLNYANNHRCRWSIRAPENHYVNLSIIDFDIPSSSSDATKLGTCIFDYLTVIDGYTGKRIGCYCNEDLPPPYILSPWNELIIQFNTNSETTGRGFYFQYEFRQLEVPSDQQLTIATIAGNDTRCQPGWTYYRSYCYRAYFEHETLQWYDAENKCNQHSKDGHLVSILDRDEMVAIHYMVVNVWHSPRYKDFYIGLIDVTREGFYRWSDNNPMSYTDWQIKPILLEEEMPAQPDGGAYEDCTIIRYNSLSHTSNWHDVPCSLGKHFHLTLNSSYQSKSWDYVDSYICKTEAMPTTSGVTSAASVTGDMRKPLFSTTSAAYELLWSHHRELTTNKSTNNRSFSNKLALDDDRYFVCDNLEVISVVLRCDGVYDCRDHSDELNGCHQDECLDWQFQCANGRCINIGYYCDFVEHCSDGSDENACEHRQCNAKSEFRCQSGQCIPSSQRCDLLTDCSDASDEGRLCNIGSNCNNRTTFQCYYGNCIPNYAVCDSQTDCPGKFHEDEDVARCEIMQKSSVPIYNYHTALPNHRPRFTGHELILSQVQNYTLHTQQQPTAYKECTQLDTQQPDNINVRSNGQQQQQQQASKQAFCIKPLDAPTTYRCENYTLRHCHDLYYDHNVSINGFYDIKPDPFDKPCHVECIFKPYSNNNNNADNRLIQAITLVHHDAEYIVQSLPKSSSVLVDASASVNPASVSATGVGGVGGSKVVSAGGTTRVVSSLSALQAATKAASLGGAPATPMLVTTADSHSTDLPISYDTSLDIISALIAQSKQCRQSIKWKCFTAYGQQVSCLDQISIVTSSSLRMRPLVATSGGGGSHQHHQTSGSTLTGQQSSAVASVNVREPSTTTTVHHHTLETIGGKAATSSAESSGLPYRVSGMNMGEFDISTINLTKNSAQLVQKMSKDGIHLSTTGVNQSSIFVGPKLSKSSVDDEWSNLTIFNKIRLPIVRVVFRSQIELPSLQQHQYASIITAPSASTTTTTGTATSSGISLGDNSSIGTTTTAKQQQQQQQQVQIVPIKKIVYRVSPLECFDSTNFGVTVREHQANRQHHTNSNNHMFVPSNEISYVTHTRKTLGTETLGSMYPASGGDGGGGGGGSGGSLPTNYYFSSTNNNSGTNNDNSHEEHLSGAAASVNNENLFKFATGVLETQDILERHQLGGETHANYQDQPLAAPTSMSMSMSAAAITTVTNETISAISSGSNTDQQRLSPVVLTAALASTTTSDDDNNNDDEVLTPITSQEAVCEPIKQEYFRCKSGQMIDNRYRCIYEYDRYTYQIGCRDVTHLIDCHQFECPTRDYVKCPHSYCIPRRYVCDGKWDCIRGDDEVACDHQYHCPGQYKCANQSSCILLHQLCDGARQCPMGDDEWFCDLLCPDNCDCIGQSINCQHAQLDSLPSNYISRSVRKLDLSYNRLGPNMSDVDFSNYHDLGELILSHNAIEVLIPRKFQQLRNLYKLDLSSNQIHSVKRGAFAGLRHVTQLLLESNPELIVLETEAFQGLSSLQILNISSSRIHVLKRSTFDGLTSLRHLQLRANQIVEIEDMAFASLTSLVSLDLRGNDVRRFTKQVFADLKSLQHLSTDSFKFCCLMAHQIPSDQCLPLPDEISDCEDLMSSVLQRWCIWIVGVVAFIGNCVVIIWRSRQLNETHTQISKRVDSALLLSLGCSDLLMGIYLIIIAIVDMWYRGQYIENSDNWRQSIWCTMSGLLATVSSEVSVFTLVFIALSRSIEISNPLRHNKYRFTAKSTYRLIGFSWLMAIAIAVAPLTITPYFKGQFYARSGVCLPFHINNQKPAGWEYSVAIFLFLNLVAFLMIMYCYICMYIEIKRSEKRQLGKYTHRQSRSASTRRRNKRIRMILGILFINAFSWGPTIALGILALFGFTCRAYIYSWIAVLFLPANSAINPMIYSIPKMVKEYWLLLRQGKAWNRSKHNQILAAAVVAAAAQNSGAQSSSSSFLMHHIAKKSGHYADTRPKFDVPAGYQRLYEYLEEKDQLSARTMLNIAYNLASVIETKHSQGRTYGTTLTRENVFVSDTVEPGALTIYVPDYEIVPTTERDSEQESESLDIDRYREIVRGMLLLYTQRNMRTKSLSSIETQDNLKITA
ncbi:hypothetical protein GZH46_00237, partial [Fragariocoptes setiger]